MYFVPESNIHTFNQAFKTFLDALTEQMHADKLYLLSQDSPQVSVDQNAERVAELKHHAVELYHLHRMKQTKGRIGRDPDEVESLIQAASR